MEELAKSLEMGSGFDFPHKLLEASQGKSPSHIRAVPSEPETRFQDAHPDGVDTASRNPTPFASPACPWYLVPVVGLITFIQVLRALGLFAFMAAMPLFGVYLAVGGGVVGAWAAGTVAAAPPIAFLLLSIGGANPRRRR